MSPLERAVVASKLQHLRELVNLLRNEASTSLDSFLGDRRQQLLVERLLHLCVEAASDLLEHLLVQASEIRPLGCATGWCTTTKPLIPVASMPPWASPLSTWMH